ncbi:MAG: hypothetical protein MI919_31210, partial [Holophagales bacterium]|nr:hypothetical protein [Holophagales bacterium]
FDDTLDADRDSKPDGCDVCPGFDDRVDTNGDGVPDACESAASIAIDNVTLAEGESGTTLFTFTVTLSGSLAGGFTVGYSTQDQTATTANADYIAASGTLTFSGTDGEQRTLVVSVEGDARVEDDEAFLVVLGTPSSAAVTVDDDTGLGTIFNDDTAALSIDDPSILEGDGGMSGLTFTVTSTSQVDGGFRVDFGSSDFTATAADADYEPATGSLTFAGADGEQQTITVQVLGDTTVEADEQFRVQLINPSRPGITIPDGTGFGRIRNDDTATLVVGDLSRAETDTGTNRFEFTATLTGGVAGGFSTPFATADGTASAADGDYAAASGTLSFSGIDGETRSILVDVNGDAALETDETFTVELGAPSNPAVMTVDGLGTIVNDDAASVSIDDVSQVETDAATTFRLTVALAGEVAGGFTLPFATADGTATVADGDYGAASGSLSFAGTDGETRSIDVAVAGDTVVEADETFTVELGAPSVAGLTVGDANGSGTIGSGTILNDDDATLAIGDVVQDETDSGTSVFEFEVTLSDAVAGGFTLPYSTSDGTATVADGDYAAASGTSSFAGTAGETQTVSVA